jgi:regulator of replication initiation timing
MEKATAEKITRLSNQLSRLYEERKDIQQDIEIEESMGNEIRELEEQVYNLNHSIAEIRQQLMTAESEHLNQLKEAI